MIRNHPALFNTMAGPDVGYPSCLFWITTVNVGKTIYSAMVFLLPVADQDCLLLIQHWSISWIFQAGQYWLHF